MNFARNSTYTLNSDMPLIESMAKRKGSAGFKRVKKSAASITVFKNGEKTHFAPRASMDQATMDKSR